MNTGLPIQSSIESTRRIRRRLWPSALVSAVVCIHVSFDTLALDTLTFAWPDGSRAEVTEQVTASNGHNYEMRYVIEFERTSSNGDGLARWSNFELTAAPRSNPTLHSQREILIIFRSNSQSQAMNFLQPNLVIDRDGQVDRIVDFDLFLSKVSDGMASITADKAAAEKMRVAMEQPEMADLLAMAAIKRWCEWLCTPLETPAATGSESTTTEDIDFFGAAVPSTLRVENLGKPTPNSDLLRIRSREFVDTQSNATELASRIGDLIDRVHQDRSRSRSNDVDSIQIRKTVEAEYLVEAATLRPRSVHLRQRISKGSEADYKDSVQETTYSFTWIDVPSDTDRASAGNTVEAPTFVPEIEGKAQSNHAPDSVLHIVERCCLRYPPQALRDAKEGRAVVKAFVESAGRPARVVLVTTSRSDALDEAALAAVAQWEFEPHRTNGVIRPDWIEIPVEFKMAFPPTRDSASE